MQLGAFSASLKLAAVLSEARLRGVTEFMTETAAEGAGPASFMVVDSDSNTLLMEQHV